MTPRDRVARNKKKKKERLLVVKLSGSLFFSDEFSKVVRTLSRAVKEVKILRLVVVAGGGETARKYIAAGESLGVDKASLDELGISASRLNAMVLAAALGDIALHSIPATLSEIVAALEIGPTKNRIIVTGGLYPGQSTNAVAALIAEKTRAEHFINATDVEGVYTKDPRRFPDAAKLGSVSPERLVEILGGESVQPGAYDLMDPIALKLITRSKIPTEIVKCDAKTLYEILLGGKNLRGTSITF